MENQRKLGHLTQESIAEIRGILSSDPSSLRYNKRRSLIIARELLEEFERTIDTKKTQISISDILAAVRHKVYQLGLLEPAATDTDARERVQQTVGTPSPSDPDLRFPQREYDASIETLDDESYQIFLRGKTLNCINAIARLDTNLRDKALGLIRARFEKSDVAKILLNHFDTKRNELNTHIDESTPIDVLLGFIALAEDTEIFKDNEQLKEIIFYAGTAAKEHLIRRLVTMNPDSIKIGTKHFALRYIQAVIDQMPDSLSEGRIGGKGSGILLAYAALEKPSPGFDEEFAKLHRMKPTELYAMLNETSEFQENISYFIGSGIFREFLAFNSIGSAALLKERYKTVGQITEEMHLEVEDKIMEGEFPPHLERQLKILFQKNLHGHPIICRSSSEQEDRKGSAFAGKYQSVELANSNQNADIDFEKFLMAIKTIYASTFGRDVMEYRRAQGLLYEDEEMGILIQLLNGKKYGNFYYPDFAAVTYSHALQSTGFDPTRGALRIGAGLGEGIVERFEGAFAGFEKPQVLPLNPKVQDKLTVIDLEQQKKRELTAKELFKQNGLSKFIIRNAMQTYDRDSGRMQMCRNNEDDVKRARIDMQMILENSKVPLVLEYYTQKLKHMFGHEVDCEFTIEWNEKARKWTIKLVQCRPENLPENLKPSRIPHEVPNSRILMQDEGAVNGTYSTDITHLIYISPEIFSDPKYVNLVHYVARYIGEINSQINAKSQKCLVLTPGRYGTEDPTNGIPVRFGQISNLAGAIEVFDSKNMPSIQFTPSAGAHFPTDFFDTGMVMGHCCITEHKGDQAPDQLRTDLLSKAQHDPTFAVPAQEISKYVKMIEVNNFAKEVLNENPENEYALHVAQDNTEKVDKHRPATIYLAEKGKQYPAAVQMK